MKRDRELLGALLALDLDFARRHHMPDLDERGFLVFPTDEQQIAERLHEAREVVALVERWDAATTRLEMEGHLGYSHSKPTN